MRKIWPILQWWLSPKFPKKHIENALSYSPPGVYKKFRNFFRTWFVHPIKRRVSKYYLFLIKKIWRIEVIGITGSAGKTTAKEMIASVLSQKYKTVWTQANIDPVYNIPNSVLHTPLGTERLVLEMGVEFPGEMDFYLWLTRPSIGVLTNVNWTHTEFFGDLNGVMREKVKLIESLPSWGYAILNWDDENVRGMGEKSRAKVVWYSTEEEKEVSAVNIRINKSLNTEFVLKNNKEQERVVLPLLGHQFVSLALAASAVGIINGLSLKEIKQGLESVEPQPHRMIPITLPDSSVIIDDTYNANPLATMEAIKVIKHTFGKKKALLVIGEMKELGEYTKKGHHEVGVFAAENGIDIIFGLGELTRFVSEGAIGSGLKREDTFITQDKKALIEKIKSTIKPGDYVLVKGSRSMAMEEIVEAITSQ